ncbi:MAG: NAD+ synthase [Candidatus Cloacimonetes bacterium]|nr:NAD+ synthase [Candidatus Cloacimonadota bacterium]
MRKINLENEINRCCDFIKVQLANAGFDKVIVGLSGGIDSAVTAALCVRAIGKENVQAVMLPYKHSHPDSFNHAQEVAEKLEISYESIDISPMVDAYLNTYALDADALRRGNRMARERMCVLFDLSAKYRALVAGTGNRSELLVGYCTQYGDSACAFEPIGHLYKTEIFELARLLDLPSCVIEKHPTADLWDGQTDEEEMGISYENLDTILHNLYDLNLAEKEIENQGFEKTEIENVKRMVKRSEFKRNMPPIPE